VVTVILAIFGTTFVLQAFKIPTGSMEDTLLIGDHLLVNKFIFAPRRECWRTCCLTGICAGATWWCSNSPPPTGRRNPASTL
jgi:hypothetical protein